MHTAYVIVKTTGEYSCRSEELVGWSPSRRTAEERAEELRRQDPGDYPSAYYEVVEVPALE
jgi:hypothetical protein